jgi:hypothetical protein
MDEGNQKKRPLEYFEDYSGDENGDGPSKRVKLLTIPDVNGLPYILTVSSEILTTILLNLSIKDISDLYLLTKGVSDHIHDVLSEPKFWIALIIGDFGRYLTGNLALFKKEILLGQLREIQERYDSSSPEEIKATQIEYLERMYFYFASIFMVSDRSRHTDNKDKFRVFRESIDEFHYVDVSEPPCPEYAIKDFLLLFSTPSFTLHKSYIYKSLNNIKDIVNTDAILTGFNIDALLEDFGDLRVKGEIMLFEDMYDKLKELLLVVKRDHREHKEILTVVEDLNELFAFLSIHNQASRIKRNHSLNAYLHFKEDVLISSSATAIIENTRYYGKNSNDRVYDWRSLLSVSEKVVNVVSRTTSVNRSIVIIDPFWVIGSHLTHKHGKIDWRLDKDESLVELNWSKDSTDTKLRTICLPIPEHVYKTTGKWLINNPDFEKTALSASSLVNAIEFNIQVLSTFMFSKIQDQAEEFIVNFCTDQLKDNLMHITPSVTKNSVINRLSNKWNEQGKLPVFTPKGSRNHLENIRVVLREDRTFGDKATSFRNVNLKIPRKSYEVPDINDFYIPCRIMEVRGDKDLRDIGYCVVIARKFPDPNITINFEIFKVMIKTSRLAASPTSSRLFDEHLYAPSRLAVYNNKPYFPNLRRPRYGQKNGSWQIYYDAENDEEESKEAEKAPKEPSSDESDNEMIDSHIEMKQVFKLGSSFSENDLSIEKVKIGTKIFYAMYDNKNNNLYCNHKHDSIEELKSHLNSETKPISLCPKCIYE